MMCITEIQAQDEEDMTIRRTCRGVGIDIFGLVEREEILNRIFVSKPQIHETLTAFLQAYRAWFQFHREIDQRGSENMLIADRQRQNSLMTHRDVTRSRLVELVDAYRTGRIRD